MHKWEYPPPYTTEPDANYSIQEAVIVALLNLGLNGRIEQGLSRCRMDARRDA